MSSRKEKGQNHTHLNLAAAAITRCLSEKLQNFMMMGLAGWLVPGFGAREW